MLSTSLTERKKALLDKVSNILSSGKYKCKNDIYAQVFDSEELDTLGQTYPEIKKIQKNDQNKNNEDGEDEKNKGSLFVTQ